MDCAATTFSVNEIEKFLTDAGYQVGAEAYYREFRRRFVPCEDRPGRYTEASEIEPLVSVLVVPTEASAEQIASQV